MKYLMSAEDRQKQALGWVKRWADRWDEMNRLFPDDSDPLKQASMVFLGQRLTDSIGEAKALVERDGSYL